jgi:hypothetical protein
MNKTGIQAEKISQDHEALSWSKSDGHGRKEAFLLKGCQGCCWFCFLVREHFPLSPNSWQSLDVLKEDMFAGQLIEKKKFPKAYLQKYGITNLYKYNLNRSHRLIYTLVADESGVAVVVLEIMNHKEYEKRFGYH